MENIFGKATFTVKLNSEPTADVTISVSSSDETEGTVSPTNLTFSSENWNTNHTVTVTGVGDLISDGDQKYTIVLGVASSSDSNYNNLNPPDVSITNEDNGWYGCTISVNPENSSAEVDIFLVLILFVSTVYLVYKRRP